MTCYFEKRNRIAVGAMTLPKIPKISFHNTNDPVSIAEWWKEATTSLTMVFQWCLIIGAPSAWQPRAASRARQHLVYYKKLFSLCT
jgi:hypothetical protein